MTDNINIKPSVPILDADKIRIVAACATDDLARLHAEFGFPENQPIDVEDMIAALRATRASSFAPSESEWEEAVFWNLISEYVGDPQETDETRDAVVNYIGSLLSSLRAKIDHWQDEWSDVCNENQVLLNRLATKQAQVDALMLEFCPNEMTPEQIDAWGRNQRRAPEFIAVVGDQGPDVASWPLDTRTGGAHG